MSDIKELRTELLNEPTWAFDEETSKTITALDLTISTPAGTFTNGIEITEQSASIYSRRYYAPSIGLILIEVLEGDELFTISRGGFLIITQIKILQKRS
jgi:hypothetical protein